MHDDLTRSQRLLATLAIALAMFLAALDQTIVGTAMPRIVAELNGLAQYAWVITAYMVASTVAMPVAGKLGDLFGRKPFLLTGMIGFVLSSALCGQSQDMLELIAFRGLQGIFGGLLFASIFAELADLFPPTERGKLMGMFGGLFGVASIIGPTLGGFLTDSVGWRWVFYVNVPVGLLAISVGWVTLPSISHKSSWRDIDFLGTATLIACIVPLLVGFSITSDHAFSSPEFLGLMALALVMGVIFFFVERRTDHPIVPFAIFTNPTFLVATITTFFMAFAMFGAIVYVALIYQGVLGIPATSSGLLMTPLMLSNIGVSVVTGFLMTRVKRYRFIGTVALAAMTAGLLLLGGVTASTTETEVVLRLMLVGAGMGASMPLYMNAVQSAVPREFLGVVSSQSQFWRQIGSTMGVSILGSVLARELPGKIAAATASLALPPQAAGALGDGSANPRSLFDPERIAATRAALPAGLQGIFDQVLLAIREALAAAIHDVFTYAAAVTVAAVIASVFLKEVPLRGRERPGRRTEPEADAEGVPAFGE